MIEIWKDIQGYEGLYQISNFGSVKSLPKTWIAGKGAICSHSGIILKYCLDKDGYEFVGLRINGKIKCCFIHKLVALHFCKNEVENSQVNHKDGNKRNNNFSNLEWVTPKENTQHAIKTGLRNTHGEYHYSAHLVLDLSTGIYYGTVKEAAFAKCLNYGTLQDRLNGQLKNNTSLIYV